MDFLAEGIFSLRLFLCAFVNFFKSSVNAVIAYLLLLFFQFHHRTLPVCLSWFCFFHCREVFRIGQDHHGSGRISASLIISRSASISTSPLWTISPSETFLVKPFPSSFTVSIPTWISSSPPAFVVRAHRMSGFKNIADLSVAGCGDLPL